MRRSVLSALLLAGAALAATSGPALAAYTWPSDHLLFDHVSGGACRPRLLSATAQPGGREIELRFGDLQGPAEVMGLVQVALSRGNVRFLASHELAGRVAGPSYTIVAPGGRSLPADLTGSRVRVLLYNCQPVAG